MAVQVSMKLGSPPALNGFMMSAGWSTCSRPKVCAISWPMVVAVIAGIWFQDINIAWLIAVAMTINLISAAISGALIPLALDRFGIDPALAGGVFLTTVTDIVGFLAFLGLATLFLI